MSLVRHLPDALGSIVSQIADRFLYVLDIGWLADFWRYAELTSRGAYDSVHWYAIPDTLPFEQRVYQDDWISDQALALLRRAPMHAPWFLEVSHQAPHPPMDITAAMQATMAGRETIWPEAYSCQARKLSPICAAAVAATKCGTGGQRPGQCQLCLTNHSIVASIKAAVGLSTAISLVAPQ